MPEILSSKQYDLEGRTLRFAQEVIELVSGLPKTMANTEVMKQIIRSSSSVGANYIEANEALSKKDFAMRVRICRKEAKESRYWLMLIVLNGEESERRRQSLMNEATELMKIFGSIVEKTRQVLVFGFRNCLGFSASNLGFNSQYLQRRRW
jgi:four helix bundle protein